MDIKENIDELAQWSILWGASLQPPLEMFAAMNPFSKLPLVCTSSTNAEHLFGFSPCIPVLTKASEAATLHEQACTQDKHASYALSEDFSMFFAPEEFVAFV